MASRDPVHRPPFLHTNSTTIDRGSLIAIYHADIDNNLIFIKNWIATRQYIKGAKYPRHTLVSQINNINLLTLLLSNIKQY